MLDCMYEQPKVEETVDSNKENKSDGMVYLW